MTHHKCSVKESSHTSRICPTVSKMGKEGVRDEAFAEVIICLKPLCLLGSENFINRVNENRAHQSPGNCASGTARPVAWGTGGGSPDAISTAHVSGICRFWLGKKSNNKKKTPLPPLSTLPCLSSDLWIIHLFLSQSKLLLFRPSP